MNTINIVQKIYKTFSEKIHKGKIPIFLKPPSLIGTVQDDPFDCWIGDEIKKDNPSLEVFHAGKLTTPDIVLRHKPSNAILGIEVKKLIQKASGKDPRGLTLDYNSCLPCGKSLIKIGSDTVEIPCFYLFALLSEDSTSIVTSIIMDGDFLNYDFELHKEAKYANKSEYKHGPYGEGSVRHRRMYTYPNPLNYKLAFFHLRHILVIKKHDLTNFTNTPPCTELIVRDDKYDNSFQYVVIDKTNQSPLPLEQLPVRHDIFRACKDRKPKNRTASMPQIPV
ncbi:hypothetical protein QUF76_16055 [Desulfobacterales bacterium HSG16]|nr:hypothetical protein [Desulfobacterales bacterium HSG16]